MDTLKKLIWKENKEKFQEAADEHHVSVTFDEYKKDPRFLFVTAKQFTPHGIWEKAIFTYQRKNPKM
jgi:hypothetical protein